MRGRKKAEEKTGNQEIDGYQDPNKKNLIDIAWVIYVGMQIGYSEAEISHMYYCKWKELYKQFQKHHNMIVQKKWWKEV